MLTDSEKRVILFIVAVLLIGSLVKHFYPQESRTDKSISPFPVNINTAGIEELTLLPGIGEVYARRIIEYRKENNNFKEKSEIMNVKGIGEVTFEKIKKMIIIKDKNDE